MPDSYKIAGDSRVGEEQILTPSCFWEKQSRSEPSALGPSHLVTLGSSLRVGRLDPGRPDRNTGAEHACARVGVGGGTQADTRDRG